MKKIISLALSVLLTVCVFAIPVLATEDLSCYLYAENTETDFVQGEVSLFIDGSEVVPGNSYTASGMVMFENIGLLDQAGAHPYVSMYSWKEYNADSFDGLGAWTDFAAFVEEGTKDWQEYSFTFTADDPTEYVTFNIGHYYSTGTVKVAWLKLVDETDGKVILYEDFANGINGDWDTPRGDNLTDYGVIGAAVPETEAIAETAEAETYAAETEVPVAPAAQTGSFLIVSAVIASLSAAGYIVIKSYSSQI
jgi:hypothetical protein